MVDWAMFGGTILVGGFNNEEIHCCRDAGFDDCPCDVHQRLRSENQGERPYSLTGTNSRTEIDTPSSSQQRVRSTGETAQNYPAPSNQGGH